MQSDFSLQVTQLSLLPLWHFLAVLAPGIRGRRAARLLKPVIDPQWVSGLRKQQREPSARFDLAPAGSAGIAIEHGVEGNLLVHYAGAQGAITIAGGWLGAGRRRYVWLPLRPTLHWTPEGDTLSSAEIGALASELHQGLDHLGERHVLEEFLPPLSIPKEEKDRVLKSYSDFMESHGWLVTYDEGRSRRSLKRADDEEGPHRWSNADREVLVRLEALVTETLKGVRSSSRILFQTK